MTFDIHRSLTNEHGEIDEDAAEPFEAELMERFAESPEASPIIVVFEPQSRARYTPVMKFERGVDGYVVRRMTYRGEGGWSWPLGQGKLADSIEAFVPKIGTDAFFELV